MMSAQLYHIKFLLTSHMLHFPFFVSKIFIGLSPQEGCNCVSAVWTMSKTSACSFNQRVSACRQKKINPSEVICPFSCSLNSMYRFCGRQASSSGRAGWYTGKNRANPQLLLVSNEAAPVRLHCVVAIPLETVETPTSAW